MYAGVRRTGLSLKKSHEVGREEQSGREKEEAVGGEGG